MDILFKFLAFLIFPGFVFTVVVGLFSSWVDRKVTARVQYRKGPPFFQPFYDAIKLLGKETILPANGNKVVFLLAPLLGLASVSIVSTIVWLANLPQPLQMSFVGDIIVVVYLLIIPSLAIIIGGAASGNPLASQGASREMKLMLAYEFPFIITIVMVILKAGGSLNLIDIIKTPIMPSISGIIGFIVVLLCVQAKLGFTPFDIAEAETEIMGGPFVEYSGPPLLIYKLNQCMLLFTLPIFMITVFWNGMNFYGWEILWSILKFVLILVLIIVIKNTNPRLRIDQAVKFFWFFCGTFSIIALVLAIFGQIYNIPWL